MTRPPWVPIKEAARRIGCARPTLWSWLSVLPQDQVTRDGKRWFLAPALVERLRRDRKDRDAIAGRAFAVRSAGLAQVERKLEDLERRVARLEQRRRKR